MSCSHIYSHNFNHRYLTNFSPITNPLHSSAVFYTDRGKKLNATVSQTGKAVGSALVNARSTVSGWWSSWNSPSPGNASGVNSQNPKSEDSQNDAVSTGATADTIEASSGSNGSSLRHSITSSTQASEGKIFDL